jgi:hypothetical protein
MYIAVVTMFKNGDIFDFFFRVRECQIVLLAGTKGCFIPAPYVDSYGETDQGLRLEIRPV